jgi:hypothetical protein
MSLSRAGRRPAKESRALGFMPALMVCTALGACSTAAPSADPNSWYTVVKGQGYASIVAGVGAGTTVEIEDDGLEAQRPPRRRPQTHPDDPTEPFSPNYGAVPAAVDAEPLPAPA